MQRRKQEKLYIISIVAVAAVILLTVFFMRGRETGMKKYVNKKDKFSMLYPADWKKIEGKDGTVVMFISEKDTAMDLFYDNVNIVIQDLSQTPMSLKDYTEIAVKQMKLVFEQNLEVVDLNDATMAGKPAFRFKYKGKIAEFEGYLFGLHYWTMTKDNKVYQFTYMSMPAGDYDPHEQAANKMFKSFKILK